MCSPHKLSASLRPHADAGMIEASPAAGGTGIGRIAMNTTPDIVIVGAGIAGSALATVLARNGLSVTLIEESLAHTDRVQGEFIVPWGVQQARALGLHDVLVAAGGHHTRRNVPYGEGVPPEAARSRATDLGALLPGVPGALCIRHPVACEALNAAARSAGALLVRGVRELRVQAGRRPRVTCRLGDSLHELRPRLVVGADGRTSRVRRQIGAAEHHDAPHHFLAGMLVEGVRAWPEEEQTIGVEGDVGYYVFPQGGGRVRLYLCYARSQASRLAGPDRARAFLSAFRLKDLPGGDELSGATPAGPCRSYPNEGMWLDSVGSDGVVLIGDAAGYDDPTMGQGIANAFDDVGLVSQAMLGGADWGPATFMDYARTRRARGGRQRILARVVARLRMEFDDAARARRARAHPLIAGSEDLQTLLRAPQIGPHTLPEALFEERVWGRLLS